MISDALFVESFYHHRKFSLLLGWLISMPPPRGEKEGFSSFKSEGEEDALKKVDPQEVDPLPTDPQVQRWLLQPEPRPRTPHATTWRERHGLSQVWRVENRGWWWVSGCCVKHCQAERLAKPLKDFIISKKWGGMVVEECHQ